MVIIALKDFDVLTPTLICAFYIYICMDEPMGRTLIALLLLTYPRLHEIYLHQYKMYMGAWLSLVDKPQPPEPAELNNLIVKIIFTQNIPSCISVTYNVGEIKFTAH